MSKKIIISLIASLAILLGFVQYNSYAKYILSDAIGMSVYIDKTAPIIQIESNHNNGSYDKTNINDIIKNNCEITVKTTDNIKIKENKYIYNPKSKDFNNIPAQKFETGKKFTDDGYYKISAIDTSGNTTEIVVLIDKTAPTVNVQYFKKGEEKKSASNTKVMQIAAVKKNLLSEEVIETKENVVEQSMVKAAQARAMVDVYNESDLRNAINSRASTIRVCSGINVSSPIYINYPVMICPASNDNALRYSGTGTFITVQNGGILTLYSMVIDTRAFNVRGVIGTSVLTGGKVILQESTILDGGSGNIGMVVNGGATAEIKSCLVAYCDTGILVQGNGNIVFGTDNGRTSDFVNNAIAICYEGFNGTANFNQSNIVIKNNTYGIVTRNVSGVINLSSYNIFNNEQGVNFGGGNLNITGGNIYENTVGIYTNPSYSGRMTITNVNLHSNTQYAINHSKNEDSSCNIYGGTIRGKVYLGQRDNYINTNDQYPTFEVTPSQYFFKRKLVKTASNSCANTELEKVTLTKNADWYKYVNDDEYIIVWRGCNVKIKYKDYFGNTLSEEMITGNLGERYETTPKNIDGYDVISVPTNSSGTYTEQDITVEYKYDLKNVAKVTFEDLLSGVVSAKYWYNDNNNQFSGNGTDFTNGTVFERYGNYKVVVVNSVGLEKELTFTLNKDSLVR